VVIEPQASTLAPGLQQSTLLAEERD